jgi:hypothetical protein
VTNAVKPLFTPDRLDGGSPDHVPRLAFGWRAYLTPT